MRKIAVPVVCASKVLGHFATFVDVNYMRIIAKSFEMDFNKLKSVNDYVSLTRHQRNEN